MADIDWAAIKAKPQSVTLTHREWLAVAAALSMRTEMDPRLSPIRDSIRSQTVPEPDVSEEADHG